MTGDAVRWMTYQEIADALGIGADSARNLVRRKRWARQNGNDGLARIGVPVEHLTERDRGGSDPPSGSPIDPPTDGGADGGAMEALEAHLDSLRSEISRLAALNATGRTDLEREQNRADTLTRELAQVRGVLADTIAARDAEATRAGQVAVLDAVLAIERDRLAEAQQQAERWREIATAPRGLAAMVSRMLRSSSR